MLRLGPGGRSQALASPLEKHGEPEEVEDWQQRLVEFGQGIAAAGELSTVLGPEESEDLPSSSENQEIQAVGGELLDEQIKDVLEHEKIKQKKGCESMFSPVIWAAKPASACRILKCQQIPRNTRALRADSRSEAASDHKKAPREF